MSYYSFNKDKFIVKNYQNAKTFSNFLPAIAGVDGNGQSELIEAITGLRKIEYGTIRLNDKVITNNGVELDNPT